MIEIFVAFDFIKKNIIIRDINKKEIEIINNKYDEQVIIILEKRHF